MNCITKNNNGAEILLDYGAGKLDPQATAEIERHAQSCDECRGLIRAQRAVWYSLDEFAPPEVSADFDQRLYARIAQGQRIPAWRQWVSRDWLSRNFELLTTPVWKPALASALACALLITGLFVHVPGHSQKTVSQGQADNGIRSDDGIRVESKTQGHSGYTDANHSSSQQDLEQVEQTLEDLDLLQPAVPVPASSHM